MTIDSIGIIGSGNIGAGLARLATEAGMVVVVSNSRGPESLADLVTDLGDRATAGTAAEAADQPLVITSVPLAAVDRLPADALAGKVVIDTSNYYPERDGHVAELDDGTETTSQRVQRLLPGAHVVKAFNNVDFARLPALARDGRPGRRAALPVSGDDETALVVVEEFLDQIGFDAVRTGPLSESWRQEPGQPVYVAPYNGPTPEIDDPWLRFVDTPAVLLDVDEVRTLLETATRLLPAAETR